ncbi:MAG: hypothetical protein KDN05_06360 [Verrucomicrobiae bacterium]|nr:hypothetical protein [Verrucomicrobiae bacterium]MCP5532277.1 hypothetical protein [Akkermansiaceae bacterium]
MPANNPKPTKDNPSPRSGAGNGQASVRMSIESLDRIPWVEFLACGVTGKSGHRTGWAALVTSRPELFRNALAYNNRPTNQSWRFFLSRRADTVSKILLEVRRAFESTPDETASDSLPKLGELLERFCSQLSAGDASGDPESPQPEKVLVSWGSPLIARSSEESDTDFQTGHFTTFDDFSEFVFGPLRLQFGAGWFTHANSFHNSIRSEDEAARQTRCVWTAIPMDFRFSPPVMSLVATARLVAFGWLPLNWNSLPVMLDRAAAKPDSKRASILRARFDEGIRIFDLPWLQFENMTALNVADSSGLQQELHSHFTSQHQTDRALLAVEFTGYGKRRKDKNILVTDRYFLFRLRLEAVSVLQRFLPRVPVKVISYSRAGSATNRAGVLSRLIDHYMVTPGAPGLQNLLIHEVRGLTYPSLPRVPFELPWIETLPHDTSLDLCLRLDATLAETTGSGVAYPPNPRIDRKPDLLQRLILNSETAITPTPESRRKALRLAYFFLPICRASARMLFKSFTAKVSRRMDKKLDREIRMNANELNDLPLSRTSHFRPLTEWRNLLKFFIGVRNQLLQVPTFLQDGIGALFRFVWVVPLEPMSALHTCTSHPELRNHLVKRSQNTGDSTSPIGFRPIYPGSPRSTRIYPLLFSAAPCELACRVELEPLLLFAMQEFGETDCGSDPGWLSNRLIETRKLMDDLTSRFDYCPDVEPSLLLHDLDRPSFMILATLASETILRSILIQTGGKELIWDWSRNIMQRVDRLLRGLPEEEEPTLPVSTKRSSRHHLEHQELLEPIEQLRIFEDPCGLAIAALDCLRDRFAAIAAPGKTVGDAGHSVYFLTDRLKRCFRPRISLRSLSTFSFNENRDSDDETTMGGQETKAAQEKKAAQEVKAAQEKKDIANIDVILIKCFKAPDFSKVFKHALELVQSWYQQEGCDYGETPEDLLAEIADEMFGGTPPRDFIEKRDDILKAFHTAARSNAPRPAQGAR